MKLNEVKLLKEILSKTTDITERKTLESILEKSSKKYGIIFEKHVSDLELKLADNFEPIIRKEREVKGEQTSGALLSGDNILALEILKKANMFFDVIYIDPPYNTGNKDFFYKDDYVDKLDSFKHSKWLSFMEQRLISAKDVMDKTGVIYMSIDDNEYANLKLLADSVFGVKNYVTTINWYNKKEGRSLGNKLFSGTYEYILVYAKDITSFETNYVASTDVKELAKYKGTDDFGTFKKGKPLFNDNVKAFNEHTRPNLTYPIFINDGKISLEKDKNSIEIIPPYRNKVRGVWTWSKDKLMRDIDKLLIDLNGKRPMIYKKQYLNGDGKKLEAPKNSLVFEQDMDENVKILRNNGTRELKKLLPEASFNNPKPTPLIEWLIDRHPNKDARVLDFFAGSGTTAQAVAQLNQKDGGNRTFILSTLDVDGDDNQIIDSTTWERIKGCNDVLQLGIGAELFSLEIAKDDFDKFTESSKEMVNLYNLSQKTKLVLKDFTFEPMEIEKVLLPDKYYEV